MTLEIFQIPVLMDNYIYVIRETSSQLVAVVDPAEAEPVQAWLKARAWRINYILNTHHHADHVGGNLKLKELHQCQIIGPQADRQRIPGIDLALKDGDWWHFGKTKAKVFDTPGHTKGHCVYWFPEDEALFCGDTLFSLGCGRLFEGTPEDMWSSLIKIRQLPDETKIYCAHEYTLNNARFALTLEGDESALQKYVLEVEEKRRQGLPTIPSRLGIEKACNPFLRADESGLKGSLGLLHAEDVEVFAEIRAKKDRF